MKRFAVGCILVFGVVVAGLTVALHWWTGPQLSGTLTAPERVFVNQQFSISLEITNQHSESVELDNIEIPLRVLDHVEIVATTPIAKSSSPFDVFGLRVWKYDIDLEPGETITLELRATAVAAGENDIEIGICNAYEECPCVSVPIHIEYEFLESPTR